MTEEQRKWFDTVIDRHNTNSRKFDIPQAEGCIPMWIADMDFKAAPCIMDAIRKRIDHGIFGYTWIPDAYYEAVRWWFKHKYELEIPRKAIVNIGGLVPAASVAITALSNPGDEVIFFTPAYNCFFGNVRQTGRKASECRLIFDSEGCAKIDWEDFESRCKTAKLLLFCNPHNPAGRLWKRDELERINRICVENGVRIISDEIHGEITAPGTQYVPFATVGECVSFTSVTKSWNLAGLQISNIICQNSEWREKINDTIRDWEHRDVNPIGVCALPAAYSEEGEIWLDCMREYIWENYALLKERFEKDLPQFKVSPLEATYLAWVNISASGKNADDFCEDLRTRGGVMLNPGTMYGSPDYVRINIACPKATLEEALDRMVEALKA